MKTCSHCNVDKPLTQFYARNKNNPEVLASRCKVCSLNVSAAWRTNNMEQSVQINKQWRADNKDVIKSRNRVKAYGTDGLALLAEQKNLCAACDVDLTTLPYKERHLDHDHQTKFVRGWLCSNCNLGIGKFKDNPKALRQAADYLERRKK